MGKRKIIKSYLVNTQTDASKLFNSALFKAIVANANSMDDIQLYKKGERSFFSKICTALDIPPDARSMHKIAKNYDRWTKPLVIAYFKQLSENKENPLPVTNNLTSFQQNVNHELLISEIPTVSPFVGFDTVPPTKDDISDNILLNKNTNFNSDGLQPKISETEISVTPVKFVNLKNSSTSIEHLKTIQPNGNVEITKCNRDSEKLSSEKSGLDYFSPPISEISPVHPIVDFPQFFQHDLEHDVIIPFNSSNFDSNTVYTIVDCEIVELTPTRAPVASDVVEYVPNTEMINHNELIQLSQLTTPISNDVGESLPDTEMIHYNEFTQVDTILVISSEKWKIIYDPQTKLLNSRSYPSIISKALSVIVKCVINIKDRKYRKSGIVIRAYCAHTPKDTDPINQCRKYILKCIKTDGEGHFQILRSNHSIKHDNKITRHLSRFDRDEAKKELAYLSPEHYREICVEKADKILLKEHNNLGPIKSQDVGRKVKSELYAENDNHTDDITDIFYEMRKTNLKKDKWIQKLSKEPFYVITHSELQLEVLKIVMNRFPDIKLTGYMDATGGTVRKPDDVEKAVYLYTLVTPVHNTVDTEEPSSAFPVSDMISSSHNIETIGGWLRSIQMYLCKELKMWPVFENIITDFSFANINAIMREFNFMTIPEYLKMTHDWVCNKPAIKNEEQITKMFLCCAHLMHIITVDVNKVYGKRSQYGKFVIEVIASLFNIASYDKVKNIFHHFCVVLKNKYFVEDVNISIKILLSEILDDEMVTLLETIQVKIEEMNPDAELKKPDPFLTKFFNLTLYENSPFYTDCKEIMDEVTISNSDSQLDLDVGLNPYYNEEYLCKFLKNKVAFLPWWSGLLTSKLEKRACNSHVEGYFNTIKKRVKSNRHTIGSMPTKALRVMKVIRSRNTSIHTQVVYEISKQRCATRKRTPSSRKRSTKTLLNHTTTPQTSDSENSICSNTSIFESKDTEITLSASQKTSEKWFKKSKGKKSPTSYFNKKYLEKLRLDLNIAQSLPTISEEFNLIEKNTDSFESEENSITSTPKSSKASEKDYEFPKKLIKSLNLNVTRDERLPLFPVLKNSTSKFINTCAFDSFAQVILTLTDHRQITRMFEKKICDFTMLILKLRSHARLDPFRNRILALIYKNYKTSDCFSNITEVSDFICRRHFPNVDTTFSCSSCQLTFNKETTNVEINIEILQNVGIQNLAQAIQDTRFKNCPNCEIPMSSSNHYAPFLTLGVDLFNNLNAPKILDSIPNELILGQQEFVLTGVVHFYAARKHYIAYCKRKNNQWECYDDKGAISTRVKDTSTEMVIPHLLVYLDKKFFSS